MTVRGRNFVALVGVLALMAGSVAAQQDSVAGKAPKQGTQVPPAQAKALEDWSYSLAVQAATWGSPAVIMYALRDHDATGPNS